MATIGLDKLYMSKITEDAAGNETYGTPTILAKAISAALSIELLEAVLFADDGEAETVKEFKSGTLSLGIDEIGSSVASELTGAVIDSNGVVISAPENDGNYVAIGFRAQKSNGKYKYYWLYRVKFGIPAANFATKGDGITFQTSTIEGKIMRRNKVDGFNKHPWKAEANEGDAAILASVITNWFNNVYDPTYTVWFTTQPASNIYATEGMVDDSITITTAIADGASAATYQWYSNTVNSITGGTLISGATSATYSISAVLEEGTYYYYCIATSGTAKATSAVARVIVQGA